MKKILTKKNLLIFTFLSLFSIFLFFFISSYYIAQTVKSDCRLITAQTKLNCVSALISRVDNDQFDYQTRNHYIWLLGQLGDEKALIILKDLYTGNIPKKEPIDQGLSQHELKKAINLIEKQNNLVKKIWNY